MAGLKLKVLPVDDVVPLIEAKAHLRVDITDEDVYIGALTKAATRTIEAFMWRGLLTQTWLQTFDNFNCLRLSRGTVQSVESVKYYDTTGVLQTLDVADYHFDLLQEPLIITPVSTFPPVQLKFGAVEVTYKIGYPTADDVPPDLVHAVKLMISQMFENREPAVIGTIASKIPFSIESLISPYKLRYW